MEAGFGLSDQFVEDGWVADGEVCEGLAVEVDVKELEAFHEAVVGHAATTDGGADPGDPERAEVPFTGFAVTGGPCLRFEEGVFGVAVEAAPVTVEAFCLFDDAFPALATGRRVGSS